jgi:hypothetical protein
LSRVGVLGAERCLVLGEVEDLRGQIQTQSVPLAPGRIYPDGECCLRDFLWSPEIFRTHARVNSR